MRRLLLRRLPPPVRWLWYAILAVVVLECVIAALGLVYGEAWWWAAGQLASLLAAPVTLGLLVVAAASAWVGRRAARPADGRSDGEPHPQAAAGTEVPIEVVVGRRAGQAVAALARSREGKEAIRRTARLVSAVRAATRAATDPAGGDAAEPRSGRD